MSVPEVTRASMDDLLIHLSQVFDLRLKASFVYILGRPGASGLFDKALSHVSKESKDYERFERSINTVKTICSEIMEAPPEDMGKILARVHMAGVDPEDVDAYLQKQKEGDSSAMNIDTDELPEILNESEEDETTLYVEHAEQMKFELF